jgi:predicted ATPase
VLVNVDEPHWADRWSLQLLEYLLPALQDAPVPVVGTQRPVAAQRCRELADILGGIARHGRSLLLGALSRDDVETYLSHVTGANRARQVAAAVHRQTEGNALFMGEPRVSTQRRRGPRARLRP